MIAAALSGLFALIWRTRKESEQAVRHLREVVDTRSSQLREALSAFTTLSALKT